MNKIKISTSNFGSNKINTFSVFSKLFNEYVEKETLKQFETKALEKLELNKQQIERIKNTEKIFYASELLRLGLKYKEMIKIIENNDEYSISKIITCLTMKGMYKIEKLFDAESNKNMLNKISVSANKALNEYIENKNNNKLALICSSEY